jgi:putative CocE/NonD family hydrolase
MTLISRLLGLLLKLPPAETYDIIVKRDLKVEMPDGVALLGDHYFPRSGGSRPTVLVRSPYGRAGLWGALFGRPFAERGFQVFIQSCRGTFGSGGTFDAFHHERADGLATVEWIKQQPWFSGELVTAGPSYLGFVQWAVAADLGPELKAMTTMITSSEFRTLVYPGESFGLDTGLTWINLMAHQEEGSLAAMRSQMQGAKKLKAFYNHLPLNTIDQAAVGKLVSYFRDWLNHNQPGDEWWTPVDFSDTVSAVNAPVHQLGGWYDIFLPHTLVDYARLKQGGHQPYLTIGPWSHADFGGLGRMMREAVIWSRAQVLGDTSGLRESPVQIYVMGAKEWRDLPDWPPAGYTPQRWHLQPGRGLATNLPAASEPDHYRYDPADPTPAVGGVSLSQNTGPKDNREVEARPDVLVYTSAPLDRDVEVIGSVSADLFVQSSLEHTDFFARLCDVDPSGKSTNVCDGLLRLRPGEPPTEADGSRHMCIDLWPTAYRFRQGDRIRVQVASASHPRFARNTGSGEPLATATTLKVAEQTVYHDPAHPSAILLPVKG